MTLTAETLVAATGCATQGADLLAAALDVAMTKHGITTPLRMAHFLAQTAYESVLYTRYVENLNYRADRLLVVFPTHFGAGKADPTAFAGHPDRIANLVYANRMGNGSYDSGDGWRFRGRGFIQLTGRANYEAFATAESVAALTSPDWLTTTEGAARSAAWFWNVKDCSAAADANFVAAVTQKVNGGQNGIAERGALTKRALAALGVPAGLAP